MTEGGRFHRHWELNIKWDSRLYRFLRKPRIWSSDRARVDRSIFAWGYFSSQPELYSLSILGILHGLTGVVLRYEEPEE